ncbi:hypothetical protein [Umezawaea sp. Da 62-37]|uniref:hypothetical protein n=1 Tax=Umezawaea sp. Da 62-37 TaxID=3075927 RepID=UPI0028F6C525|nr:hypothetical protein [Umezawaea sp. Da 62-37]WNV85184.1 hypothetical protein RM788_44820 [Umezawaea sp. Da 62-37]
MDETVHRAAEAVPETEAAEPGHRLVLPEAPYVRALSSWTGRREPVNSVVALEKDIREWVQDWNEDPKPFLWRKTADEILDHSHDIADESPTNRRRTADAGH